MLNMTENVKQYEDYIIAMRREIHRHPEVSMEEYRTSELVCAQLDQMKIPHVPCGGKTGILATIQGGKPGKTVLLRADMDALTVQEETGFPFASEIEGMMHACGHDAHTAMLLGAAALLNDHKAELCGTVKLAFQPGEEVAQGAKSMVDDGALEGVDACFGQHIISAIPKGKVVIADGPVAASCDQFRIDVTGVSGHASMPQASVDSIVVCSEIINNLQTIVSRETDPLAPAVVTVGRMEAGTRWNVIAGTGVLEGTTRTFDPDVYEKFPQQIERIAKGTAELLRAKAELTYNRLVGVMNNDADMASVMRNAGEVVFGAENVIAKGQLSGSEDFAEFSNRCPGAFAIIGLADETARYPNHHNKFQFDESILSQGAALLAQTAVCYLNAQA